MRRLLALTLLGASGCIFMNMSITPPPAVGAGLTGGKQRAVAVVVPFADERAERDRCGRKKVSWNWETAKVYCAEEPALFLADLLAKELAASGFRIVPAAEGGAVRIEGRLLQFFVEPLFWLFTVSPEADVHVRLVASSPTGLLAERDFYVKGIEESLYANEDSIQQASNAAVRAVVKDMVAAIISLLDRYPDAQLGVSASTT
jgi:hypothetical protein